MKMKNIKDILSLVAMVGVLTLPALVLAEEGGSAHKDKSRWEEKIAQMHKELGVTPEQEKALANHRQGHRQQMEGAYKQLKSKNEEMKQELQKNPFDEARVKALNEEIKALEAQKQDVRLNGILEVRKILTPEQFNKFIELKKERKMKKGSRMGMEMKGPNN